MPSSPDPAVLLEYQRSLVASMIAQVAGYQRLAPVGPEAFQWSGEARRRYGEQLASLRDALWVTRAELDEAKFYLEAAIVSRPG